MKKQVDRKHYQFDRYMSKTRWASVWHQVDEVQSLNPGSVLEVGPGFGAFKALMHVLGVSVSTLDVADDLEPDYIGSVDDIPLAERSFDVVCGFQVLEHLPYDRSLVAFAEMVRVSRKNVIISLPDARAVWACRLRLPFIGNLDISLERPSWLAARHRFDGEHYWELNKRGWPLRRILKDFTGVRLLKTYRVPENPYHRFFVFERLY